MRHGPLRGQRQPDQRGPAGQLPGRHRRAEQPGHLAFLGRGEGQVRLADLDAAAGRPEPGQRDAGRHPPAEHHVPVARQPADDLREQPLRRRAGDLVHVVDDQADVQRRQPAHHPQHVGALPGGPGLLQADRPAAGRGELRGLLVVRLAGHPGVDTDRAARFCRTAWASSVVLPNGDQPGHLALLGRGEGQVRLADLDAAAGRPQPGQRDAGRHPPAEHHVPVARQPTDDLREQPLRRRAGDLVHVVDDQADVQRRQPAHHRQHVGALPGGPGLLQADRPAAGRGELRGLLVVRLAGHPGVDTDRAGQVLPHSLGQQRGLAEPRAGHQRSHRPVEPPGQQRRQPVPHHLAVERGRRPGRGAEAEQRNGGPGLGAAKGH